ncbi:site-specific integrase [Streptomyces sodiiphilus]|uniref:Site-specific integrase n=1 Tax=Streptomyces sodiiphilus TaxID=226217 RepID=A0ABN2PHQ7_9ACTN
MAKRGNGLGSTPVEISRKGRANTWGVRTPLHFDRSQGKHVRPWIGRDFPTKTAAERALRKWITDHEAGKVVVASDMALGDWLDKWLKNHRKEGTTMAGYETKIRLHIKPHIGTVKLKEITEDTLDDLYRLLETAPCPTNKGKPLGAKSVRHVHNILSRALGAAVPKLIPSNPAATAHPPTQRQIKAQEQKYPTLNDSETTRFLRAVWEPCGIKVCDGGLTHHCLRDAPLWTFIAVTGCRRSEALGLRWEDVHWATGAVDLSWVVVEEGNVFRHRPLTKDGDDAATIYVDQSVINVLKWQRERQRAEIARLGAAWTDHGLVFARDGHRVHKTSRIGGPQDPEKVSARWRRLRTRLRLPEGFRIHDLRHSYVTNGLEAGENPVEVSANVRHHSPGYTMARYGHSRKDGAIRLAASSANRVRVSGLV